jgi:hypothetical protein
LKKDTVRNQKHEKASLNASTLHYSRQIEEYQSVFLGRFAARGSAEKLCNRRWLGFAKQQHSDPRLNRVSPVFYL